MLWSRHRLYPMLPERGGEFRPQFPRAAACCAWHRYDRASDAGSRASGGFFVFHSCRPTNSCPPSVRPAYARPLVWPRPPARFGEAPRCSTTGVCQRPPRKPRPEEPDLRRSNACMSTDRSPCRHRLRNPRFWDRNGRVVLPVSRTHPRTFAPERFGQIPVAETQPIANCTAKWPKTKEIAYGSPTAMLIEDLKSLACGFYPGSYSVSFRASLG